MLFLHPLFQMLPEDQQECDGRHDRTDPVCQGLSIKGASGSKEDRKDYGKQHIVAFPEYRQKECGFASPKGSKAVHKYILEAERDDHQCENVDSPYTEIRLPGIFGEDTDEVFRYCSGYQEHDRGKGQTQQQYVLFCRFYPDNTFGSVIVAEDRLGPAGDPQHGTGDQHHIALNDSGACDQKIPFFRPAVSLQHRIQHDQDHTVCGQDQEGRNTQSQDPAEDHRGKIFPPQEGDLYGNFFPCEEPEGKSTGYKLGDDSSNGCPCHVHM